MIDYKKLAGESIVSLVPYQPGKPVKELERELGVENAVKLASNENPLGPSQKVIDAVTAFLPEASRYPLGDAFYLREKMAEKLGVDGEKLIFGTGSNEIIELVIRTFMTEGEHVMSFAPSFSVYGIIAQAAGFKCEWIPMTTEFTVDFKGLKDALVNKPRIIFLANPNNPTGGIFTTEELTDFMDAADPETIVVMDEAYFEYADAEEYPDSISLMDKYPNMIVMRTFSKAYGLAAFRVGYAIAQPECIDLLNRVRQPFNTNMLAQVAAETALADTKYLEKVLTENKTGKEYLYKEFERLGCDYIPTQANFILVNVKFGEAVFNELLKEGIIVRYLGPGLGKYIRVSIGTMEENKIFIEKLEKVLK